MTSEALRVVGLRQHVLDGLRKLLRQGPVRGRFQVARAVSRTLVPTDKIVLEHVASRPMVFDFRNRHEVSMYFDLFASDLSGLMKEVLRPGDTFVDAGANIGYFSCLGAALVDPGGKVYAIDANPFCADRIAESKLVGKYDNLEIVRAAVGAEFGSIDFNVADDPMYSSLVNLNHLEFTSTKAQIRVPMLTLSGILGEEIAQRKAVRLLKVDIEGAEVDALAGAASLLDSRIVQNIYIEVHYRQIELFGKNPKDVDAILRAAGYAVVRQFNRFSFLYRRVD